MRRLYPDLIALVLLLATAPFWLGLAYRGQHTAAFTVEALPVMLPTAGLHEPEPLVDRPGVFRWTDGAGELRPPNPGGPLYLRLSLSSGFDTATPVELAVGERHNTFTVLPGLHEYALLAPAQPGERVILTLRSPTVKIDGRHLGIVVHRLVVTGAGSVPPLLLVAMLLATASLYGLARRAGMGVPGAAAAMLALQAILALWQWAGAWYYGLLGVLLVMVALGALGALVIERLYPPLPPTPLAALSFTRRDRLALGGLLLLTVAVCLPWLGASDPVGDLKQYAARMGFLARGGFAEAFTNGGDYMPLWLLSLRLLAPLVALLGGSYFDAVPSVTRAMIKLPSLVALLITVLLLFRWARRHGGTGRATLIAGLYAVTPPVWMNAAWWGQIDVLLALPMLVALSQLDRWRGRVSWLGWAVGLMIKPQAIILAPLLYGASLRRHGPRGLLEGGLAALAVLVGTCTPLVLLGQGPGLYQATVGSVGRFPQVTNRAYNLWWLVVGARPVSDLTEWAGMSYRTLGFLLLGVVVLLTLLAVLRRPDGPTRAVAAATLALAFFTLPTQIHERYIFFALPMLLLGAMADLRLLLPYGLIATGATLNILGVLDGFSPDLQRMISTSPLPVAVAWVNLGTLAGLLLYMLLVPRGGRWPTTS